MLETCRTCRGDAGEREPRCPRCGTTPRRTQPTAESAAAAAALRRAVARCPRCAAAMSTVTIEDDAIDVCSGCGGTWYDSGEFEAHIERMQRRGAPPAASSANTPRAEQRIVYLDCPRCGEKMHRKAFDKTSGVIVDVCADHGVFLDPGELAAILRYLAEDDVRDANRKRADQVWAAAMAMQASRPPSAMQVLARDRRYRRSWYRGLGWWLWF